MANCPKCGGNRFDPTAGTKVVKCMECGMLYNPSNGKIDPKVKARYEIDKDIESLKESVKDARDSYILDDSPGRALLHLKSAKKKVDALIKKLEKVNADATTKP